ncbi:MAG: ribosome-recycling factor [Chromatiales bacterium]|nr:ribosome-recycling factor [Chromatiales bacterium]
MPTTILKELLKEKEISEDDERRAQEADPETHGPGHVADVEKVLQAKEAELMEALEAVTARVMSTVSRIDQNNAASAAVPRHIAIIIGWQWSLGAGSRGMPRAARAPRRLSRRCGAVVEACRRT